MFDIGILTQLIVSGLVVGSYVALITVGYSLVKGVLKVINIAHGAFYMLGGYFLYLTNVQLGMHIIPASILSPVIAFFLGILVHKFALRASSESRTGIMPESTIVMMITLGVAIFFEESILLTYGSTLRSVPRYFSGALNFGGILIESQKLFVAMICIVIILFLSLLLKKTKMGKAIRMMAENQDLAKIIGIDVSSLHSITFSLGVSLAAVAGCMLSSVFPLYPAVGWENLTLALAVGMLAGMGSIEGTIVAGVIYGIVDSFTGFYISSQFRSLSIFILIFVILVLRPYGLMGKAGYEQMD